MRPWCSPVSVVGRKLALHEIEPVLSPEQLAIDDVGRRAEDAPRLGLGQVGLPALLDVRGRRVAHQGSGGLAGSAPRDLLQRVHVGDVAVFGPEGALHREGEGHRIQTRALDGDHRARGDLDGAAGIEAGLQVQRDAQVLTPARQLQLTNNQTLNNSYNHSPFP